MCQFLGEGTNLTREQNKLAGQSPARESNIRSNKTPTKALIPPETPTRLKASAILEAYTPILVSPTKDLFIKYMKVFMKLMQTQTEAVTKPQK